MNTKVNTKHAPTYETIAAELAVLKKNALTHAETIAEQADRLTKALMLAKGTRETVKRPIDPARPFFVGGEADTNDLFDAVERCITDRPRTLRELVELTGCENRNRISGVLVKLQVRKPRSVVNLGDKKRALWWMPKQKPAFSSKTER